MSNIKIEHREEYKDGELSKEYFVAIEVDKDGYYSNSHIFTREELEAIQRYEIPKRKETV